MRLRVPVICCLLLTALLPTTSAAQTREPHALSVAIGGDVGILVADSAYEVGFSPSAFAEVYLLPRVSVRWTTGWARNGFLNEYEASIEQVANSATVVVNWEAGVWHPFVAAGGGWHSVRLRHNLLGHSGWYHQPAVTGGIGIEYFSRPKVTIKAEARYAWVDEADGEPQGASGWVISVGLKKYF